MKPVIARDNSRLARENSRITQYNSPIARDTSRIAWENSRITRGNFKTLTFCSPGTRVGSTNEAWPTAGQLTGTTVMPMGLRMLELRSEFCAARSSLGKIRREDWVNSHYWEVLTAVDSYIELSKLSRQKQGLSRFIHELSRAFRSRASRE